MSGVLAIPFLHTAWLLAAAAGAWITGLLLPERRWRLPVAIALGAMIAGVLAALGVVPLLGTLHLAWYGFFMLLAFIAAYVVAYQRAQVIGVDERSLIDITLVALLCGLAGARARYVWERPQEFLTDSTGHHRALADIAARMIDFDGGGMVWYGGLSLATLGVILVVLRDRLRVLAVADLIAPALLVGLAIGRIGCFVNGCCYGRPTTVPWAVHRGQVLVHPTQLYETLACATLAGLLWWYWGRRRSDGMVAALAVAGYGIWRFINEGLRGDDRIPSTWLGLPASGSIDMTRTFSLPLDTSQVTSLQLLTATLVVAVVVAVWRSTHPQAAAIAYLVPGSRHARPPVEGRPTVSAVASSAAAATSPPPTGHSAGG